MIAHDFNRKLAATTEGSALSLVTAAVRRHLPEVLCIHQTSQRSDRLGLDYLLELPFGQVRYLEVKLRDMDYGEQGQADVALETFNNFDRKTPGWTLDPAKLSDYVLILWRPTRRSCLFDARLLRAWFSKNWRRLKQQHGAHIIASKNGNQSWRSECLYVPHGDILRALAIWQGFQPKGGPRSNHAEAAG